MARYSYIFTQIWKDRKFRQLDDSGQKLFIALLSAPSSNMVGYYNWPLAYALHDLNGWDEEKFRHYMGELERAGMAAYDFEAEVVLVSNFLKYNPITNIKQLAGAFSQVQEAPLSPLFMKFYGTWKTYVEEPYRKSMDEKLSRAADEKEKSSCLKSISEADRVSEAMKQILDAVSIPHPEQKSDCESTKTYPIDRVSIPYPSPIDTVSDGYGSGIDDQIQVQVQVQSAGTGAGAGTDARARATTDEGPPEASEGERKALEVLEGIPGYPFEPGKDLEYIRRLKADYPDVVLTNEFKRARDWLDDQGTKRKIKNFRSFLRNWVEKANQFQTAGPQKGRKRQSLEEYMRELGDDPLGFGEAVGGDES